MIFPFVNQTPTPTYSDIFSDHVLPKLVHDIDQILVYVTSTCPRMNTKAPAYLHDYHYSLVPSSPQSITHSKAHPIQNFLSYDKLSTNYRAFVL